jgi:hypothetical protein
MSSLHLTGFAFILATVLQLAQWRNVPCIGKHGQQRGNCGAVAVGRSLLGAHVD